jgi:hypothetical protein
MKEAIDFQVYKDTKISQMPTLEEKLGNLDLTEKDKDFALKLDNKGRLNDRHLRVPSSIRKLRLLKDLVGRHEAGHALAVRRKGGIVNRVTAIPGPGYAGITKFSLAKGSAEQYYYDLMVISFAGGAAAGTDHGTGSDYGKARLLANILAFRTGRSASMYLMAARSEARSIVAGGEDSIEAESLELAAEAA